MLEMIIMREFLYLRSHQAVSTYDEKNEI